MIREAYDKHFSERIHDRDDLALHVSDLADCSRAVWARRNGKVRLPHNADTQRKFDMGLDIEERVGKVLANMNDYVCEHGLVHELEISGASAEGHSDFFMRHVSDASLNFIVEVKSTTFYPVTVNGKKSREIPRIEKTSWHYRIQAASYALERGCPRFCMIIICRESGMMAEHWFDTVDYANDVRKALKEKYALTGVGAPMPPAEPPKESYNAKGKSWRCSYCPLASCEKNENPAALELAI